ncbi:hypothetical protein YC2023_041034 [Brassica napus]
MRSKQPFGVLCQPLGEGCFDNGSVDEYHLGKKMMWKENMLHAKKLQETLNQQLTNSDMTKHQMDNVGWEFFLDLSKKGNVFVVEEEMKYEYFLSMVCED